MRVAGVERVRRKKAHKKARRRKEVCINFSRVVLVVEEGEKQQLIFRVY